MGERMSQGLELSGMAATVALALPFVLLLWTAVRGTRARPRSPAAEVEGRAAPEPLPPAEASPPPPAAAPDTREQRPESQRGQAAAPEAPAPAPPSRPTAEELAAAAKAEAAAIAGRAAGAEAQGQAGELPRLYLAEARALVRAGEDTIAAERLRSSIRASAKLGQKVEHAEARLELGDLAAKYGDLTTACEHWSIARGLMHELKHAEGIGKSEARMRDNRCPTDWVLNDF